jgi:hypothetical protein
MDEAIKALESAWSRFENATDELEIDKASYDIKSAELLIQIIRRDMLNVKH